MGIIRRFPRKRKSSKRVRLTSEQRAILVALRERMRKMWRNERERKGEEETVARTLLGITSLSTVLARKRKWDENTWKMSQELYSDLGSFLEPALRIKAIELVPITRITLNVFGRRLVAEESPRVRLHIATRLHEYFIQRSLPSVPSVFGFIPSEFMSVLRNQVAIEPIQRIRKILEGMVRAYDRHWESVEKNPPARWSE